MKAAIVSAAGAPPVYGEFRNPVAGPGELCVTVLAAAMSHVTRSRASGAHYSAKGAFPFVPGIDGVGRLDDGRRVYFLMPQAPFGAMAQQTVVGAGQVVVLPDGLDDATAAALAIPAMSSWAALTRRAGLVAGETVLINGATGASGRLAVQIARHLGAGRIIATGRNVDVLHALGADVAVPLTGDGEALEAAALPVFADGVDVVLDYLWGPSAERLLVAAAKAGRDGARLRFIEIGSASGGTITLPSAVLRASAIELMGSGTGSVDRDTTMAVMREVFSAAGPANLHIATRRVPLGAIAASWSADDAAARTVYVPEQ